MVVMWNKVLTSSFYRKGIFTISLSASNALDDSEVSVYETIRVTDVPNCYPPEVSIIGNRAVVII